MSCPRAGTATPSALRSPPPADGGTLPPALGLSLRRAKASIRLGASAFLGVGGQVSLSCFHAGPNPLDAILAERNLPGPPASLAHSALPDPCGRPLGLSPSLQAPLPRRGNAAPGSLRSSRLGLGVRSRPGGRALGSWRGVSAGLNRGGVAAWSPRGFRGALAWAEAPGFVSMDRAAPPSCPPPW